MVCGLCEPIIGKKKSLNMFLHNISICVHLISAALYTLWYT